MINMGIAKIKRVSMEQIFDSKKISLGILIIFGVTFVKPSSACEMSKPEKSEVYVNSELGILHYGNKNISDGPISTEIHKCQKDIGKFLMFSIGVKRPSIFSDVEHISYDGKFQAPVCSAVNSSLNTVFASDESVREIERQHEFIRSCMIIKLRDIDRGVLEFDPNQVSCKVRAQSSGAVSLDGDYCFIKLNPQAHLQMTVELKQDCLNPEYLAFNKISSGDFNTVVNTWVSGDQSGVSTDLDYVRSVPVHLSLMASSKIAKISENIIKPEISFPNVYSLDVNPGPVAIQKVGANRYNLDFALEASNQSSESCKPKVPCFGNSNFRMPLAGSVELSQFVNGQEEFVQSWPFLATVAPHYRGIVKNIIRPTIDRIELKPNEVYHLKFLMIDPFEDYKIAAKKIAALKFNVPVANETLDGLQSTPVLDAMMDMKAMGSLPSSMTKGSIEGSLDELNRILRDGRERPMWPQRYDSVCIPASDSDQRVACQNMDRLPEVVSISIEFKAGEIDPSTNRVRLNNVKILKRSSILPKSKQTLNQMPKVECNL